MKTTSQNQSGRDSALRCPRRRAQRQATESGGQGVGLTTFVPAGLPPGTAQRAVPTAFGARRLNLRFKLRALAVGEIGEWPVFNASDKFFPHGVFQNVICFLPTAFIVPQAMFEKIALPADADFLRRPFFPFADDGLDCFAGRRKRNQRVQMVGHEQKNVRPPQKLFLPVTAGFKETFGNFRQRQLVATALQTVDADKINFPVWVNPQWNIMRQGLSFGRVHAEKVFGFMASGQTKNGRDSALRCPRPERSAGRNGRGWTRVSCVRFRRLTLRSATGTAQRAIPTTFGNHAFGNYLTKASS